jgi:hypothetical protein
VLRNLLATLGEARHPGLLIELDLLDRTLQELPMPAEDLALAMEADLQGLGAPLRDARLRPEDAR